MPEGIPKGIRVPDGEAGGHVFLQLSIRKACLCWTHVWEGMWEGMPEGMIVLEVHLGVHLGGHA